MTVIGFGFVKGGMNPALAVLLMFAIGAGIGAFTGALITLVKIPPFIATLGMMVALRGFALVHSAGTMHFGLRPRSCGSGRATSSACRCRSSSR